MAALLSKVCAWHASQTRRRKSLWARSVCVPLGLVLVSMFAFSAYADEVPPSEIEELKALLRETQESMQRMMQEHQAQIEALSNRIEEMESRSEKTDAAHEELEAEVAAQNVTTSELESSLFGNISLHGYDDFQYIATDSSVADSFVQNELAIFLRHASEDEKWTFFSELEFELSDDGSFFFEEYDDESEFEVETAWIEYHVRDGFKMRAGKHLLPQYWQTYHYPNLTLSTRPPAMVGRIFPKNIIGVQTRGDFWFPSERGLSYVAYLGNGGDTDISEIDTNENKAIGGRLTAHLASGKRIDTFDLSVSGYSGKDENDEAEDIFGFDAQIRIGKFELLSEFAFGNQVVDAPENSGVLMARSDTEGYYVQAAYQIAPRWHMFYRFDKLELFSGDGDFDSEQHTLGANFRPRPNLSLKLELFHALLEGENDRFNGLATSIVYNF